MNLAAMIEQVSNSLDEGRSGPVFYPRSEIIGSLNEGQRLFCLLTLTLETTATWSVAAATPFTHMLTIFPDWIAPLRIATTAGVKIRPARLADMAALSNTWRSTAGDPARYCYLGADLVGIYKQPADETDVKATYARGPVSLANDSDVPEIPEQFHSVLVDYGKYRPRQVEGGQEMAKGLGYLEGFLEAAAAHAAYVRARNQGADYDRQPMELTAGDWSRLVALARPKAPAARPVE